MGWEVYLTVGLAVLFFSVGMGVRNELFRKLATLYSVAFLTLSAGNYLKGQAVFADRVISVMGYAMWLIIFYINYRLVAIERKEEKDIYKDTLTGLKNRAYFDEVLREKVSNFERLKISYAVFFVDMDNLKQINDTYGHEAGDLAISRVGQAIGSSIRLNTDMAVRYGGDEFVIVAPIRACGDALVIASRIEERLKSLSEGLSFSLSASIGFACYPDDGSSFEELLKLADKRMYEVKSLGKHNVSGVR